MKSILLCMSAKLNDVFFFFKKSKKVDKSLEVLYYEPSIRKFKFFYIECIAAAIILDQPFYFPAPTLSRYLWYPHNTIPKPIFDIDKSASYKGILAIFYKNLFLHF